MEKVYTASEVAQIIIGFQNEIAEMKNQIESMHQFLFPKPKGKKNVKILNIKQQNDIEIVEALQKIKKNALRRKAK